MLTLRWINKNWADSFENYNALISMLAVTEFIFHAQSTAIVI